MYNSSRQYSLYAIELELNIYNTQSLRHYRLEVLELRITVYSIQFYLL
jgi:hypothetical protein